MEITYSVIDADGRVIFVGSEKECDDFILKNKNKNIKKMPY